MAIKYKVVLRGQPGVEGGGIKKYYGQIVTSGESTIDEMVKDIEKFSALSEPDIRGVIIALENEIQNKLTEGKIVRLEKLGSLYPAISSEGVEKAEDLTSKNIREIYINYRPGDRLKLAMKNAGLQKIAE
jgi:predicted histone-like DNA-binding protein